MSMTIQGDVKIPGRNEDYTAAVTCIRELFKNLAGIQFSAPEEYGDTVPCSWGCPSI